MADETPATPAANAGAFQEYVPISIVGPDAHTLKIGDFEVKLDGEEQIGRSAI